MISVVTSLQLTTDPIKACFESYHQLINHIEQCHPLNQEGGRQDIKSRSLYDDDGIKTSKDRTGSMNKTTEAHSQAPTQSQVNTSNIQSPTPPIENEAVNYNYDESALRNSVQNRLIYPTRNERYDILTFFANTRDEIANYLRSHACQLGGIK